MFVPLIFSNGCLHLSVGGEELRARMDAWHAASLPHALPPPQAGMQTAPTQEPRRERATLSVANVLH